MAFTLLHTADCHLGKSFSELPPERAEQRRNDLLATLMRVCRLAKERKVDLLCIAGDLFDRPAPSVSLLAAARHALAEAGVPILLIPGNHDPLDDKSPYLENRWPGNVMVASAPGWQRMPVAEAEVWAFGYTRGEAHRSAWVDFPGCGADALLTLHAACLAPGLAADASYYPFSPGDIPACAYLALGHHHRPVQVAHGPLAWYAGSPEPLEAEAIPAAALLVTLDGKSTAVESLDVTTRHHQAVTLDVTGLTGGEIWERALAAVTPDDLLTLTLTGLLEPAELLDIAGLRTELSARCFAADVRAEKVQLPPDFANGEGVMGALQQIAQKRMQAIADDHIQQVRLERALRYAAAALEGRL
ncbi:MAG: metallophosphoesterase family protein [Armatimonadota bacterium]